MNSIPIVFAANNRYTPYVGVAISSVIQNCSHNFEYYIYILHRNITPENIRRLESLSSEHVRVECFNVEDHIKGVQDFQSLHLTQEAVYRLLIPELFPQYDKIVYLDSDLVVTGDVAEFYQENIDGYLLGAVHDVCNSFMESYDREHLELSVESAFNSGVLLMNIPLLLQMEVKSKCIRLLEEDVCREQPKYWYLDQDVLNLVCAGQVRFLDYTWNFQSRHLESIWVHDLLPQYKEQYLKAADNCRILHYSGYDKPWLYPWVPKGEVFEEIAKQSIFYKEITARRTTFLEELKVKPPLCNLREGARILLYGAGAKGKELWELLRHTHFCSVALWVDRNASVLSKQNEAIRGIEAIYGADFDQAAIAIENRAVANTVFQFLKNQGICEEKIIWAYRPKEHKDESV